MAALSSSWFVTFVYFCWYINLLFICNEYQFISFLELYFQKAENDKLKRNGSLDKEEKVHKVYKFIIPYAFIIC